jgi:hypothetical protein
LNFNLNDNNNNSNNIYNNIEHKEEDHENGKCLYKNKFDENNKSLKELMKINEDINKQYDILIIKSNQE